MRRTILTLIVTASSGLFSGLAFARDVTVNIPAENVVTSRNQLAIAVALPAEVMTMRVHRVVLEVPIAVRESADSVFSDSPLLELYEDGSELRKQTVLLAKGFSGIARFDVTRFAREWSTTDARSFVLGSISASNGTVFELGTSRAWSSGVKARLIVLFSDRDEQSVAARAE